jgi:coenzyme F420-reducing hydrogenase alpha subunit
MGPVGGVRDPGTRYISTIASLVDAGTDESIREVLNGMRDAAGYLYRVRLTHLRKVGWNGLNEGEGTSLYRVGPLGRFNVCEGMATPLAQKEYEYMVSVLGKPCHLTMAYHWARLLEALQAAEEIYVIAKDPLLTGKDIRNTNLRMIGKGVGCVEACRGVLIHDYETDNQGLATKINLIVATQHNAAPICLSVKKAAKEFIKDGKVLNKDGLLNMVEMAFRAYDPCLGCATHTIGWRDLLIINVRNIFYTVRTFHSKEQFTLRTLLREMKNVSEKITGNARFTQKAVS